jgi:hypothetical protein
VCVFWIARQTATTLYRFQTARENGDAIPTLLAMSDCAVARFANRSFWKFLLRRLQFLKARNIRLGIGEPAQEHREQSQARPARAYILPGISV